MGIFIQNQSMPKSLARYMSDRRAKHKKLALDYLGNKCAKCGSIDGLEFDHIDHTSRCYVIGSMLSHSWETILKELRKCQLLCSDCHGHKTTEDRGYVHATHGRQVMYRHYKCRCSLCVEANRKIQREYMRRKRANILG